MILPRPEDTVHKIQLLRLLTAIIDSPLSSFVFFKGGTCAGMLGVLDRFSIDLDFDYQKGVKTSLINSELKKIFRHLELEVEKKSREPFYLLKYQAKNRLRNSIKLSLIENVYLNNIYKPYYLREIDRYAICQTIETMFSHKLVSLTDRFKKYRAIAGRDLYDIHHFFLQGYRYSEKLIIERTKKQLVKYLRELKDFIESKINNTVINEDLNYLLPYERFKKIRKTLKKETILLLDNEIERIKGVKKLIRIN